MKSNKISSLPSSIFNHITHLHSLFVFLVVFEHNNHSTHLSFSHLNMDISSNSLVSLPKELFSNLRNLNSLYHPIHFLIHNHIIIVCLFDMNMKSNKIAELPIGVFDNNINLHNLHPTSIILLPHLLFNWQVIYPRMV